MYTRFTWMMLYLHEYFYIKMDDTIYIKSQRLELLFKTVLTKYIVLQPQKRHIYHGAAPHGICVFVCLINFYLIKFL